MSEQIKWDNERKAFYLIRQIDGRVEYIPLTDEEATQWTISNSNY
jgi:hypothetical protein